MEEHVAAAGAGVRQNPADFLLHGRTGHVDVHLLVIRQVAHH
jgi:hypothetical protein